jgi:hypothetical protein
VAGAPVVEEERIRVAGDEVMGDMQAAPVVVAVRLMKSPKKGHDLWKNMTLGVVAPTCKGMDSS